MRITVLAGGVGAARFLEGLSHETRREDITVIGNTGDDLELYGLHISPDLDTVMYTLAGVADPTNGWGVEGDTFEALPRLARLTGDEPWFRLGDRDLATHIRRTFLLREGRSLSAATDELRRRFGVRETILPMSDDPVRTYVATPHGELDFQTYFVRRRASDDVHGLRFEGSASSTPATGVLEALRDADLVIIAPSNPLISIRPILEVPGVEATLKKRSGRTLAISPLVRGRALKGPTVRMMTGLGLESSAVGVANLYQGLIDTFVLDDQDPELAAAIQDLGLTPRTAPTIMKGLPEKRALARACLEVMDS